MSHGDRARPGREPPADLLQVQLAFGGQGACVVPAVFVDVQVVVQQLEGLADLEDQFLLVPPEVGPHQREDRQRAVTALVAGYLREGEL
jgi:hypothetical protein